MNHITNILYWISTGMLVPVIVLLILLFIRALILIGGFFGQFFSTRKNEAYMRDKITKITEENIDDWADDLTGAEDSLIVRAIKDMVANQNSSAQIQYILDNYEIMADKDLSLPKVLTKLCPMLGLMGTLIPMGPALVGLSTGDIASMAYNMQVAFATTEVGLVSSAIGFVTQQFKRRWHLQNLSHLELIAGLLNEKREKK